ncbi:LuxR C-terminal-related transcriptional regulator [Metasolibacillus meyeri]|uniref:LuxR C-terminal-related transcriptional regulator n=1 Tax=Metasolibacillus meyeri TaxID=1071052 RepID=A0AAW9NMC1_9BACL|nr:LuxR C-terminal-related transcriptional regulator [Metasolibacillus meyeri]MEC1176954.1 LuxR C-terminal-related transcriptional regulator [Metasolibacillus meyeri]
MIKPVQFILFCKIYRTQLMQNINSYIQLEQELTAKEREEMIAFSDHFLQFIIKQHDSEVPDNLTNQLQLFIQVHWQQATGPFLNKFRAIFEQSTLRLLFDQKHPQIEPLFMFLSNSMVSLMQQYYVSLDQSSEHTALDVSSLEQMDEILIRASSAEELPSILEELKAIFQFKRCIFYVYIPWKNEFKGMFGDQLEIVQNIKGKLTADFPIFSLKQPLYLREPHPYIEDEMIEKFNLSSMIFIPVADENQLYGWLELDQKGEFFPYSQMQLDTLALVGKRLGLLLSRKPTTSHLEKHSELNDKEHSVIYLIAEGYSNKEIASILFLSEFTVRDYVQRLLSKLQAKNRTHLVSEAFKRGIL